MQFKNKVALVTGGSSGIGFAIASLLVTQGAQVIITGRNAEKLANAVAEIGPGASGMVVDVTSVAEVEAMCAKVGREYGHLDILVPNAGSGVIATLGSITEEQVDQMMNTLVKGVIFTVQSALKLMKSGGSITIIGSTASINPSPGMSVYGAAKAAVRNLVRAWIQEQRGSGIRINVVSPGPVHTVSLENFFSPDQTAAAFDFMKSRSTVGRIGTPDDIAHAVAYLASDSAGYVNGVEFFVDGGASQF